MAYHRMDIAEEREVAGDVAGALAEYEAARAFLSGNDEATFWSAVLMADAGRVDEARALFDEITAREPGWAELVRRLPDTGLLRGGRSVVEELLAP
ncbi:MAG: tetratricopeptide repeat protein [Chloroflexi bacterium]|nr:MAG: tetratricopeptide repeat protein [Chloroflexota bacterium]